MRKTFLKKAFCSILFLATAMGYSQEAGSIGTLLRNEAKASDINSVRIQVDVQGGSQRKPNLGDYRTPRILGKDLSLNPLGLDLRAQIKCAPVGIYATYSLLPLFLDKGLPSTSMYSVGVSLGL